MQLWHWCSGGSEPLALDEWEVFFPISEDIPCVQGMGRNHRDRERRCTILCVTNVYLLPHRKPMVRYLVRLGAHPNLSWAERESLRHPHSGIVRAKSHESQASLLGSLALRS